MTEPFLMYWLLWLQFIIIYFFMGENRKRHWLSVWILAIISGSTIYLDTGYAQLSLSLLIIVCGAFIYLVEHTITFVQLVRVMIMMLIYCVILIWQLVAPVWFFLPGYFLIPFLMVCTTFILCWKEQDMYPYLVLGISLGQLLFDMLLYYYQLHDTIGMPSYFIHLSLAVLLFLSIQVCFRWWSKADTFLKRKWT